MTIQEAAAELDCTHDHVRRLIRTNKLVGVKKNGTWQVNGQSVRKYRREVQGETGLRLVK